MIRIFSKSDIDAEIHPRAEISPECGIEKKSKVKGKVLCLPRYYLS